ncbi:hypothetical protein DLM45_15260 [Hyphomicrobium methylovorum]|nr:hypothetical protein [Hyphomicrobium methylovorum]
MALPASATLVADYVAAKTFCTDLSLAPRDHCFVRDGAHWNVWCFAVREDAETFRAHFGGEFLEPSARPKWPGK